MRKTFAAVLLAGGRSTRMNTNKAFLEFHGVPLWRFQMEKLERLGPDELFFSVQPGMDFPPGTWMLVCDRRPDCGPLGGLEATLRQTHADFLVTLAVDMPAMTTVFLHELVEASGPAGVVPLVEGFYCGAAAVYPVEMLPLVETVLAGSDRSFQRLIREAAASGLMNGRPVSPEERLLFENWNAPEDRRRSLSIPFSD
ncbi:MAG TPA: molybdenum cofactor guanylyltransferase [Terrimicrobiaceae bacterium]|nr:molybdenum cofactor guanylyltransferase [Terrimicrobiaceae bacterium]